MPPGHDAVRSLLGRGQAMRAAAASIEQQLQMGRQAVVDAFETVRERRVWADLELMPIDRVKDVTAGRLRLGALAQHGYGTVAAVLRAGPRPLLSVPGVGEATAQGVCGAAEQIARAVRESMQVRIDLDPANPTLTALLGAIRVWEEIKPEEDRVEAARGLIAGLSTEMAAAEPAAAGSFRRFFMSGGKKQEADRAVERLTRVLTHGGQVGVEHAALLMASAFQRPRGAQELWADFEKRSAVYYGLLGGLVDLGLDVAAAEGFLPAEIVAQINAQPLDDSRLTVPLRGYQAFGARFALVQRRVVLGDEMGLGKTMQALAAVAHLTTRGATHFLVVCPASVLINWGREIAAHTTMSAYTLHGNDRERAQAVWHRRGGIAVTTFDMLWSVDLTDVKLSMLVVDEAHFVKNPSAKRSKAVARIANTADRVLFMTGTPMENRVDEFRNIVMHLQPAVARQIDASRGLAGADSFRRAVAPVYLRRNQRDVLAELPELVQVDEWEEFGPHDWAAYRSAVLDGNFMAMRRAAFNVTDVRHSAKIGRLLEIVDEAATNGRKVVVFSYFRDVLQTVTAALGHRALGPITGSLASIARQRIVDEFTKRSDPAVLVAQIEAGGVGLNIQAASVVVLCEPQVKPTTEAQAIARAHRMGQVRTVQVHRLLVADSVDQRMLEILGSKRALFDAYVRDSAIAAAAPGAVDISEVQLARTIVEQEQERLAMASMSQ